MTGLRQHNSLEAIFNAAAGRAGIVVCESYQIAKPLIYKLAQTRNCHTQSACGSCRSCRRYHAGTASEIIVVEPTDKPSIGIEAIRQLIRQLSLANTQISTVRFVIIQPAELLTAEGQNALLKTLEEPPVHTNIILCTARPQRLLETIRSRCPQITINYDAADEPATAAINFLQAQPFDRLLQAKTLAEQKIDGLEFSAHLQRLCLTEMPDRLRQRLAALERYRQHVAAGVTTRATLESLGMEL